MDLENDEVGSLVFLQCGAPQMNKLPLQSTTIASISADRTRGDVLEVSENAEIDRFSINQ